MLIVKIRFITTELTDISNTSMAALQTSGLEVILVLVAGES